jgi:hypothetical protein
MIDSGSTGHSMAGAAEFVAWQLIFLVAPYARED